MLALRLWLLDGLLPMTDMSIAVYASYFYSSHHLSNCLRIWRIRRELARRAGCAPRWRCGSFCHGGGDKYWNCQGDILKRVYTQIGMKERAGSGLDVYGGEKVVNARRARCT